MICWSTPLPEPDDDEAREVCGLKGIVGLAPQNKIPCDHRTVIACRGAQLVTFPMLRTVRMVKKQPHVLTDHRLWR